MSKPVSRRIERPVVLPRAAVNLVVVADAVTEAVVADVADVADVEEVHTRAMAVGSLAPSTRTRL